MVTRAANLNFIDNAICCYISQTYENKELIIVPDCDPINLECLKAFLEKYENERIKLVIPDKKMLLGALRNMSIKYASGDYCIQWDDDDLYHAERIEKQFFHLVNDEGYDYCLLKNYMMYFRNTKLLSINRWPDHFSIAGKPASIMFRKNIKYRYPDGTHLGEDIVIAENTKLKYCLVDNMPFLYIYNYHGRNCYDYQHYLNLYCETKISFDMNILEKVMPMLDNAGFEYRY
jgi:glycosyltransferase involved in cell wall biosynthesis